MRKSITRALVGLGLVAASVVVTAQPASAAACQRNGLTTGYQWPGTTVRKASGTTCRDLNLVHADDSTSPYGDFYAGFYRNSAGTWFIGTRGYLWASDGPVDWLVLLSDVRSGTPMGVGSGFDGGDAVTVAH